MPQVNFTCPICRYDKLTDPPADHEICPCCGTEFGEDDYDKTHETLRWNWIARGMPWFSRQTKPPANWNPETQLGISIRHSRPSAMTPRLSDGYTTARLQYRVEAPGA